MSSYLFCVKRNDKHLAFYYFAKHVTFLLLCNEFNDLISSVRFYLSHDTRIMLKLCF